MVREMGGNVRKEGIRECAICNASGTYAIRDVKDPLFGSPGLWSFRKCDNRDCGHMWLDPRPIREDIGLCYKNYYTHADSESSFLSNMEEANGLRKFYNACKEAYWGLEYGYPQERPGLAAKIGACLFYVWYRRNLNCDMDVRFLPYVAEGKLLDVGCGSGGWIEFMKRQGWDVSGIDIDEKAVDAARKRGLDVASGNFPEAKYPEAGFDAVTMSHVIEHLHNVDEYLKECKRILKPNGKLVLITPNNESFGFWYFKTNWRGLEPPRHLHIFSGTSISKALKDAGFARWHLRWIYAPQILYPSQFIKKKLPTIGGSARLKRVDASKVNALGFIELILMAYQREYGGVLMAEAWK